MVYFPQFTRCGKTLRVSLYRRIHCRNRQMAGNVVRKPRRRELLELHCVGLSQLLAYKQKNSSIFCYDVSI